MNAADAAESKPTGRTAAAQDWVAEHGDYLLRYALSKVRDRDAAEDLVQDTLLAAWRAREKYSGESSVRTWLCAILNRKVIDSYRRRVLERATFVSASDEERFPFDPFNKRGKWKAGPKAWAADPAANLDGQEFRNAFSACVAKLPQRLHDPFVLRYLDEATGEDVAKEIGLTPANLWVILHRARLQMWQCLSKTWFGSETQPGDKSC